MPKHKKTKVVSRSYPDSNKIKFTGEMRGAYIGRQSKLRQREVAPAGLMVKLSLVDGELGGDLEAVALDIILDTCLGEQMLEISGEVTLLVNIRSQERKSSSLHFVIGNGVHELALRLMRNVGPDCGMVCAAH